MDTRGKAGRQPHRRHLGDDGLRKVVAIVRSGVLKKVETRLLELRVPGITVTRVKGYGEHANFFSRDWMIEHARIEIILRQERADEIVRAIVAAASSGLPGDGIVVVIPVESVYRIRSGERATADNLGGCECESKSPEESGDDKENGT